MSGIKARWKPALFLLGCMMATNAMAQTADTTITKEEIVDKAWTAMFGGLKNADIKSVYAEGYFHGSTVPSRMTVKRPNLFRNDVRSGILVFDGQRAAWAKREPDKEGKPRGPEMIDPAQWRHFEVDIALLFPAFFEFPAEDRGIEKVTGVDAYRLFVRLPLGSSVTYFIDSASFLVTRRLVCWDGDDNPELWENLIGDYTRIDGILYPDGYSYEGRGGMEKGYYKNVRFNIDPADEIFQIPQELK